MEGHDRRHLTLELKRSGGDAYHYTSSSVPRGMFRMALPDAITQATTFRIINGRVVPSEFRGSDEKERPVELIFDWDRKRVTGVARDQNVDLELHEGTQDPMSLQIASLRNLATGTLQTTVRLVDADKIKEYELNREGTAQIETGARHARHRDLHQQARRWRSPHAHLGGPGARLSAGQGRTHTQEQARVHHDDRERRPRKKWGHPATRSSAA